MSPSSPETLIASLEEQNPQAVELAEVVAFAVRAEPFLLRKLRFELLPHVDSGAEADLWLSAIVQFRSPAGIVFYPEVADTLRRRLRTARSERFGRAWSVVEGAHQYLPPFIQLEEKLAYLSADPRLEALHEIEIELQRAVKTLIASGREGITNWAARALPRLPARVRSLESARMLAWASYTRLTRRLPVADLDASEALPSWLGWVLPGDVERTPLRVRLVARGLELQLGETGERSILIPDVEPCPLEVSWTHDGRRQLRHISLRRGEIRLIQAPSREFHIRTVLGDRYRLAEKQIEKEKTMDQTPDRKICFVVMGFGRKTDYQTGRVLDLDKSYTNVIKPAVEASGLQCLRADEIVHAGIIDMPMYEQLLTADVVIADLSTTNPNAIYDLGVRHALRPYTTIIIAESQFKAFFDFGQTAIHRYQHLGEDIGYTESVRIREDLTRAIQETMSGPVLDSPVYTFLKDLRPPARTDAPFFSGPSKAPPASPDEASLSRLVKELEAVTAWPAKVPLLQTLRSLRPDDPYYTQQLALATYKSKLPDEATALSNAREILSALQPEMSTDPETLGLWGAIHKRIWDVVHDRSALDVALDSYEKGFLLKNDYYNGINYAFLLNVRATTQAAPAEAVADFVLAQRIRRKVIAICEALLAGAQAKPEDRYWIYATLAEAHLGVGDRTKAAAVLREASEMATADWMRESTDQQMGALQRLLAESPLSRFGLTESPAL